MESELEQSPVSPAFYKSQETLETVLLSYTRVTNRNFGTRPTISHEEAEGFLDHYSNLIKQSEVVTISGSLPSGLPNVIMKNLSNLLRMKE
uniref:hypothetical protein n=1 Tax=Lactococcus sp. TaxID=44273 RepID=UPI003D6D6E9A